MNFLNKKLLLLLLFSFWFSQFTFNNKGCAQYNYFQDEETPKKKKKKKKKKIREDQDQDENNGGEESEEDKGEEPSDDEAPIKEKKKKAETADSLIEEKPAEEGNQNKIQIEEPLKEAPQKQDENDFNEPVKEKDSGKEKTIEEQLNQSVDEEDPFEKENKVKKKKPGKKEKEKQAEKERKKQEKIVNQFLKDYKLIIPLETKFYTIFEGVMINEFFTGTLKNKNVAITEKFVVPAFGLGGEYQFFKYPVANLYMFFEGRLSRGDMFVNLSFGGNKISNVHLSYTSLDLAMKTRWVFMLFETYSNIDLKFGYLHTAKDSNANEKIIASGIKTRPTSANLFTSVYSEIFYLGIAPAIYFSENFGVGLSPQLEWIPVFSEDPQFASGRDVKNFGYSGTADFYLKVGNFTILDLFACYQNFDSTFGQTTMSPRTIRSNVKKQELLINFIRAGFSLNFIL